MIEKRFDNLFMKDVVTIQVLRNGSKELIKDINRFKVLNIIRNKHPISRNEISKQYNLGSSTLFYIIDDLKRQGLINEVGESSSTGGRRAKLLEFNKNYGYTISVKIEERQILIALTNMKGEILFRRDFPIKKKSSPELVIDLLEKSIHEIFIASNTDISKLMGIGILSSGLVNRHDKLIIRSSMLGWDNVPFGEMLKERFNNTRIFIDNNINGYTLAEMAMGVGKENNNFLVLSVGAGLGLSIVINNRIYYGSIGGAGEFGHSSIVLDGYPCHCGRQGCLEMYASEFYFENRGKELISKYPDTTLDNFHFSEVAKRTEENDELAKLLINEMSYYLGHGIANLINTLNPELVVVVGEGMDYDHLFMNNVLDIANENFFSKADFQTEIVRSSLQEDAWLTGGALLTINHIFREPIYERIEKE